MTGNAYYHIRIAATNGRDEKELLGKTVQYHGDDHAKAETDLILRNYEGGKSHFENVRAVISMKLDNGQWKAVWARWAGNDWKEVRSMLTAPTTAIIN